MDTLTKQLIEIVKDKSIIWDSKHPQYGIRVHRQTAWQEVYAAIEPNYHTLPKYNKTVVGNTIMKKWYNLVDAHNRAPKRKFSSILNTCRRPYKYSELLSFLNTHSDENNSETELNSSEFKNVGDSNSTADVGGGSNCIDNMFIDVNEEMCETITKRIKRENDSPELSKQRNNRTSSSNIVLCKEKLMITDLIELIKEKKVLWDKSYIGYLHREKRDMAWKELYRSVEPKFDELNKSEQNELGDYITKKWYNIRDAYVKYLKSAQKNKRPYIYAKKLKFLEPHIVDRNVTVIEYSETNAFQDGDESDPAGDSDYEFQKVNDGDEDINKRDSKKLRNRNNSAKPFLNSDVMKGVIPTEDLIRIIKKKRLLWDRTCLHNKHKEKRVKAWRDVYKEVIPNFDKLTRTVQHEIGIQISKKWVNIRDTYVKSLKNVGSKRPYVHSDLLTFLDAQYQNNSDSEYNIEFKSVDDDNNSDEDIEETSVEETSHFKEEVFINEVDEDIFKSMNENCEKENESEVEGYDKNKINNDTQDKLLSALENLIEREEDEERSFFNAILSSVKSLSDNSKIEFRISVLQLIQTLKRKEEENLDTIT